MNSITFPEPCHDPWYAATTLMDAAAAIIDVIIPSEALANTTGGYYVRDEPARVLGCTSQYQYCNPISKSGKSGKPGKSCTPLAGWYQATAASFALWSNDGQRNLFNASLQKILGHGSSIDDIVKSANIASLKAREKLQGGLQGPLPDNQWQLEVENWYGGSLAVLQGAPVNYATGPIEPALLQILNRPQTESERRLCDSVVSFFFSKSWNTILFENQLTFRDDTENPKRRCHFIQYSWPWHFVWFVRVTHYRFNYNRVAHWMDE